MLIDALIPARAGSRRLPGKHMKLLGAKPLIDWTYQAAIDAGCFRQIVLSTDDPQLVSHTLDQSQINIVVRPGELAGDETSSAVVVQHYLKSMHADNLPDWLMLLQPTSPFRSSESIRAACALGAECVSVGPLQKPGQWLRAVNSSGLCHEISRCDVYTLNGAIYLINVSRFLEDPRILSHGVKALRMTAFESVDIDTPFDLAVAALMLEKRELITE